MRLLSLTLGLALLATTTEVAGLPRSDPEAQGVSSKALRTFVEAASSRIDAMHSIMVVRHGHVVAEGWWQPYRAELPHSLFSLSKSFTSTAVGLAIAEGKLSLHDPVLKFFPDEAPAKPSDNLKAMRISDLLRMSTGQQTEPPRPSDVAWTKAFLAHPVPFRPGTHFLYNTSATYMLSAIVQKATGQNLLDYLTPRLFEPLGIEHPTWETSPQGISTGGYGLSIRTEDIAKFGQLYLQKGEWNGKTLIPAAWIEQATALQTSNGSDPKSDWNQGYGYQFWRSRHNAYRGDGAFGQYCIVLPEHDAVIAITSAVKDMQAVLNLVWDELLPAFQSESLPANPEGVRALRETIGRLSLPTVGGMAPGDEKAARTVSFSENEQRLESLRVEAGEEGGLRLVARIDGKDQMIVGRPDRWTEGRLSWGRIATDQRSAASLGWTGPKELTARICFVETPFAVTLKVNFEGDEATLENTSNVGFGPTKRPPLKGKVEPSR